MNGPTILSKILIILVVVLTSGCASLQKILPEKKITTAQSSSAQSVVTQPISKQLQSQVYIYRNETLGAALSLKVTVNGKLVGTTGPKSFLKISLPAGKYSFASQGDESILEVTIDSGKQYYIWQEIKMGLVSGGSKLRLVDEKKGRLGVKECTLIRSTF
jgi:hypothetical protein